MARGEGIKSLSNLFDKYKNSLIAPERTVVNNFIEVTHDLYGWDLKPEHLTYSPATKTISVKASGPLRSEIQLNKEEILTHLKGRLGVKGAPKNIL